MIDETEFLIEHMNRILDTDFKTKMDLGMSLFGRENRTKKLVFQALNDIYHEREFVLNKEFESEKAAFYDLWKSLSKEQMMRLIDTPNPHT